MSTTRSLRTFHRTFRRAFRSHHEPIRITDTFSTRYFSIATSFTIRRSSSPVISAQRRCQTTESEAQRRPLTDRERKPTQEPEALEASAAENIALRKALSPAYQLWFTCKKCMERSGHTVSKQAYHYGTCVINCPKCKNQHLISDNLKIFSDTNVTLEEIAKEHGEKLKKGKLGADGDIEFYDEEAEAKIEQKIGNMVKHRPRVREIKDGE